MSDEIESEVKGKDSMLAGVSVRALIVLVLVLTAAGMSLFGIEVVEPLYTLVIMSVSYYFGQKQSNTK